ncbi:uncharacterized protein TRUGW13939_11772 [Talaromyces rugulosus]|uniref:3'-5' exonuclease domain-containing protein n=1 Tax=Talaromyces rugulosus TaxID=121627 RepID=A0A7H8REQ4_TALRU|nr:uncharacterized protein TRUGW13939_11772 [Talaromyces rugulosus]QKX64597.1 hypothetical protein TRUGW13939_11772 [Talaromyces rugulosus]
MASQDKTEKELSSLTGDTFISIADKFTPLPLNKPMAPSKASFTVTMIDTENAVSSLVDNMSNLPNNPPSIYLDLEGENLSRHGTLSIIQIYISTTNEAYLVDVHTLGNKAFVTPGTNDSDALYSHFDVSVAGIQDIQLMEVARRPSFKKYLSGLSKCIEKDGKLSTEEQQTWLAVKDKGRGLFAPELGGSYKVFNQRPLSKDIQSYCVQDVQYLARLWKIYDAQLTSY